jgi:hypothetical protein
MKLKRRNQMLYRPINRILDFLEELNMFLFSCDWRHAFKKEKPWDNQGSGRPYIGA